MKSKITMPTTKEAWLHYAIFYCSQREASRQSLKYYLRRKLKQFSSDESTVANALPQIEFAIDECVRMNVVNEERYVAIVKKEYQRRGKGSRYISLQLRRRGLKDDQKTSRPRDSHLITPKQQSSDPYLRPEIIFEKNPRSKDISSRVSSAR